MISAGASRQSKSKTPRPATDLAVDSVLTFHCIRDGFELDFVLSVTPRLKDLIESARLFRDELKSES